MIDAAADMVADRDLRVREAADVRMFLIWQLGMLPTSTTTKPAPATTPSVGGA